MYKRQEAELQDMLDNIESEYPGYDEYRVNADEIEPVSYTHLDVYKRQPQRATLSDQQFLYRPCAAGAIR